MEDNVFSFAFIADPQIGLNSPFGLEGIQSDKARLERAIEYVNESDVDFVVLGGDLIHAADSQEQLDIGLECLAGANVPVYGVPGNHDQHDPRVKPSIYLEQGAPSGFSFVHKKAFFLGFNDTRLRGDYGEELQEQEWELLRKCFAEAPAECDHRFVFMHWCLFVKHPAEEDTYWNMPNRRQIVEFFRSQRVSCVVSAHWHQDLDAGWNGIHLLASVGICRPLQYPEETSFKIITVSRDGWSARRVAVDAW